MLRYIVTVTDPLHLMSNTTTDKYCRECDSEPCLWYEHKEVVIAGVENWILIRDANGGTRYSPNECRKYCYQQCVRAIHGILGRGERLQLPQCVIAQVRNRYPNPEDTGYMGFRDE